MIRRWWDARVLPTLVERVCGNAEIEGERRAWIPRARGRVVEVGIGSGLNLPHYDRGAVTRIVGVDPSRELRDRAAQRARASRIEVELVDGVAEQLPFPDAAFDTAVTTYTLCSVADPVRAAAELARVLRPGGTLIFVEHGLAPDPKPRRWQRALTPAWRTVGGNCHLDRDILALLAPAGFAPPHELATGYRESGPRWFSHRFQGLAIRS